ncbi:MAG: IS1182 family transposase [Bacteroidota bacterium]
MCTYIQGQNRTQTTLFASCLDDAVSPENEVRLIDAFVQSLDIAKMGFRVDHGENGRPAYHPKDLLKLYIYGYLNRIRTSRQLEKETKRNIEVMWLLNSLSPDHNTISNFRRDNGKAIKKVFRETVRVAQYFNLIGGTLIAGDSTKLRAQNSKKNNFNQKKIDRHLEYIDKKLEEYQKDLAENDGDKAEIEQEIAKHTQRKKEYTILQKELEETGDAQISTSDPESRQMIIRNNITEVAYNVQTTVDAEHNIPIDYKTTNNNDSKAMGGMLRRAKSILHTNTFTALYDKGYHTGTEFHIADQLGIEVMVAVPAIPRSSEAPNPAYNVEHFIYNEEENTFTCPQGEVLRTNGTWHTAKSGNRFQQFKTAACKNCSARAQCTKSVKNGKVVQRGQHARIIQANKQRVEQNKTTYRRRQAIVEHPYGTIKRQWGFNYILTKKTIARAEADVGFIMTAYNLRRLITIIGIKPLIAMFRGVLSIFVPHKQHVSAIFGFIFDVRARIKSFVIFSLYSGKVVLLLKI